MKWGLVIFLIIVTILVYSLPVQSQVNSKVQDFFGASSGKRSAKRNWSWRWLLVPSLLGALGLLWRKRKPAPKKVQRPLRPIEKALRLLARRGHQPASSETLRQFSIRVEAARDPAAAPFSELVDHYYAIRFGENKIPLGKLDELLQKMRSESHPPRL